MRGGLGDHARALHLEEQEMTSREEVVVPCPVCDFGNTFTERAWRETFRAEQKWDGRKKEYRTTPGPDSPITCARCLSVEPASRWHRSLERREFAKTKQWRTPN